MSAIVFAATTGTLPSFISLAAYEAACWTAGLASARWARTLSAYASLLVWPMARRRLAAVAGLDQALASVLVAASLVCLLARLLLERTARTPRRARGCWGLRRR